MNTKCLMPLASALILGLTALVACSDNNGGGSDNPGNGSTPPLRASSPYVVRSLVSDGSVPAEHVDANLKNPWGLAFNPMGPVWVANNGTNTSTLYDGNGAPSPLPVPLVFNIPAGSRGAAAPTGIVYNGSGDFTISQDTGLGQPAAFIFAGEAGTITAWSTTLLNNAVTMYDDGTGGAIYKGLAIASNGAANFLYATDFAHAKVDVFDKSYARVTAPGGFHDPNLPAGYAPFGIQAIGNQLYVTYAKKQGPADTDETAGPGLGLVNLFDADGHLIRRFASGGALNAPWGVALAPADFGSYSGNVLIGNFGDGLIHAFDATSGQHVGTLKDASGQTLRLPGLWGIAFGPGVSEQPTHTLFAAAGVNDEAGGLYVRIDPPAP